MLLVLIFDLDLLATEASRKKRMRVCVCVWRVNEFPAIVSRSRFI